MTWPCSPELIDCCLCRVCACMFCALALSVCPYNRLHNVDCILCMHVLYSWPETRFYQECFGPSWIMFLCTWPNTKSVLVIMKYVPAHFTSDHDMAKCFPCYDQGYFHLHEPTVSLCTWPEIRLWPRVLTKSVLVIMYICSCALLTRDSWFWPRVFSLSWNMFLCTWPKIDQRSDCDTWRVRFWPNQCFGHHETC